MEGGILRRVNGWFGFAVSRFPLELTGFALESIIRNNNAANTLDTSLSKLYIGSHPAQNHQIYFMAEIIFILSPSSPLDSTSDPR